jgi:quercetin dioxygenase-like cupin family protein
LRWARAELLGRWPAEAGEVRTTPTLFPMRPANWLHTLSGVSSERAPRRVSLFVATEHLIMGRFDVLPGQSCEPEVYPGEQVLLALAGRLQVLIPETGERFELAPRDAIYLPPGVSHQYVNGASELAQALFAVAPGIGKAQHLG